MCSARRFDSEHRPSSMCRRSRTFSSCRRSTTCGHCCCPATSDHHTDPNAPGPRSGHLRQAPQPQAEPDRARPQGGGRTAMGRGHRARQVPCRARPGSPYPFRPGPPADDRSRRPPPTFERRHITCRYRRGRECRQGRSATTEPATSPRDAPPTGPSSGFASPHRGSPIGSRR